MLEARDISFGYVGSDLVFSHFTIGVKEGERLALSAPSGFGKSTLCKLLSGYEQPQKGEILLDGAPLSSFSGACPAQLISQHPERAFNPLMRMKDALAEAQPSKDALAEATSTKNTLVEATSPKNTWSQVMLDALGIKREWLTYYPGQLSGGQLQRFCIARALACNPRFLIADEISSMLDAITQAQIWEFLLDDAQKNNRGLIFVSHSEALLARLATRTLKLDEP